jgi:hypothetical protein
VAAISASALLLVSGAAFAVETPELVVGPGASFTADEGLQFSDQLVATFVDHQPIARPQSALSECQTAAATKYTTTIAWGDGATSTGVVTCGDGAYGVTGSHVYKDSGTFHIDVTVKDNDDGQEAKGTDTATATVTDASIRVKADNAHGEPYVAVEGAKVTVFVNYLDNNEAYPTQTVAFDPGITATIDWGDGVKQDVTPTGPTSNCECSGFIVTASHVYDARSTDYVILVTATDDGGSTGTDELSAKISDAKLTAGAAKSFVAPGAQASTPVVASFTDAAAAQAAVGDFNATITWGDGTSSAGTLTQTAAGAFDVKGTHTYATAGTKALTIKVDDDEGQTITMTATATVPALPTTGHPQTPVQPSLPMLPLVAMVLGLAIAGGGLVFRRMRS